MEPDGAVNDVSFNPRDPEVRLTGLSKSKIGLTGLFQSKIGLPGSSETKIRSTSLSSSFCRCQRFKSDLEENLQLNNSYCSAFSYHGEYQQNDSAFSYQVEYQDDDPVFFTMSYCPCPSIDNRLVKLYLHNVSMVMLNTKSIVCNISFLALLCLVQLK